MNVTFRVDASSEIGTGHLMRCLTLADVLAARGADVTFVTRDLPPALRTVVAERGHPCLPLPDAPGARPRSGEPAHTGWLPVSWEDDAAQTVKILSGVRADWLVVDHYALDARWESRVRPAARRLMAIDDLADRPHDCDVLLDQNLLPASDTRYVGLVPASCECWLGPRFLLLREGFARLAPHVAPRTGPARRALIAFAGADTANHTAVAIRAVAGTLPPGVGLDVIVSAQHPARDEVAAACAAAGFTLLVQVDDLAPVMAAADLAIAACGFVCYELAAMRVPSILVPLSPIQAEVARALAARGAAVVQPEGAAARFRQTWLALLGDDAARAAMSQACGSVTDGQGALRVAEGLAARAAH